MDIFILIGLILLNGVFAMSEIALVTARKVRLAKQAADGMNSAKTALKLAEDPTHFLSTIQIGITCIGILNGIFGEAILAQPLSEWLQLMGLTSSTANVAATVVVVVVVTYVSIVVGELVPKRLGQLNAEPIACLVARPMQLLAFLARPFVLLLSASTHALIRLMGIRLENVVSVTEEEIHAMLAEGSESGVIERHEHEMVRNVFRLDDRAVASLMVPRADIVFVDLQDSLEVNLQRMSDSEHSIFPVCRGGLNELLGVITARQVMVQTIQGLALDLEALCQPCTYIPETLSGMELLEHFRTSGSYMAFVVDEYSEFQGIVTVQDVLESLTGEFYQEDDDDAWAVRREDGSWLLDGLIPVMELKDCLQLEHLPEEERNRYHTLSGLVMLLLGRVPVTGDILEIENWRLEVVDMDGMRIDKVLASRIKTERADTEVIDEKILR
ncbi:MAG: HlyC/CorC family transporter [Tolumonas sp.]|nr:MAG: HlyC/CorC family transporter [Tolumonas sp.]